MSTTSIGCCAERLPRVPLARWLSPRSKPERQSKRESCAHAATIPAPLSVISVLLCTGLLSLSVRADILIRDITLIDAINGSRPNSSLLIQGDRIASINPTPAEVSQDADIIEGGGRFLIPGLWDSHVHYTFDPEIETSMPALLLAHGVTSVRDTGGLLQNVTPWAAASARAPNQHPDYFFAGPLLDGAPPVYAGQAPGYPTISVTVDTPEVARSSVQELVASGASLIKAYEMLQVDVLAALVSEARSLNVPVTAHVPLLMSALDAARAGISSFEHLRNLEIDCSSKRDQWLSERRAMLSEGQDRPGHELRLDAHRAHRETSTLTLDWAHCQQVLAEHAALGVIHIPTLALILAVYEPFLSEPTWQQSFDLLPQGVAQDWRERVGPLNELFTRNAEGNPGRDAYLDWVKRTVSWMADKHMLMAGTDSPLLFMTPGVSLHKELEAMVSVGVTPLQALEAATLTPARYFSLAAQRGSIDEGKVADLVLLEADPLIDIRNTRRIAAVIRRGVTLDRQALDGLLTEARQRQQDSGVPLVHFE